jgi:hypothetical protein
MKKILVLIVLAVSAITSMAQESVKITTTDGKVISGYLVNGTETELIVKITDQYIVNKFGNDTIIFQMSDIHEVYMYDKTFVPGDGGLVAKYKTTSKRSIKATSMDIPSGMKSVVYTAEPGNLNYAIGKALKSAGGVSLGIGIPSLAVGTALLIAGHTMPIIYTHDLRVSSQLIEAGTILFPIGASLTIVGIPLHIHGKKIMDINFNYTGNGVGMAMVW